jgi:predicted restriction endonuclease
MERFFSWLQRREHDEAVGHQCEWEEERGVRCRETRVEADHVQPWSKGGKTEEDNFLWLCIKHHILKHELDEEPYSANLIRKRLK